MRTYKLRKYGISFLVIVNNSVVRVKPIDTGKWIKKDGTWAVISKRYMGIAKCHPNDKFSLKIGVRLATLRLMKTIAKEELFRASKKYNQRWAELTNFKNNL